MRFKSGRTISRLTLAAMALCIGQAAVQAKDGDGAIIFQPPGVTAPAPLLVMLHGAGQQPAAMIEAVRTEATKRGIVVFAPKSVRETWDVVDLAQEDQSGHDFRVMQSPYSRSRDAALLRTAIANVQKQVPIDPKRIVVAGYSDGASMALAVGLDRRVPASSVLAFAPGIPVVPSQLAAGRKAIIAHGRQDPVIPFNADCHEIARPLRDQGVDVRFRPFDGGHEFPAGILHEMLDAAFGPAPGEVAVPLMVRWCET
jgi:phospholipase/carboxylesterase